MTCSHFSQGTNFYKYFYALMQRLQENEIRTSEIVLKIQQYFANNEQHGDRSAKYDEPRPSRLSNRRGFHCLLVKGPDWMLMQARPSFAWTWTTVPTTIQRRNFRFARSSRTLSSPE